MSEGDTSIRLLAAAYALPESEVEAILGLMPLEHRAVLLMEHDGTRRPQAVKAASLGCSLAGYKASLVCARAWLRGAALSTRAPPHDNL